MGRASSLSIVIGNPTLAAIPGLVLFGPTQPTSPSEAARLDTSVPCTVCVQGIPNCCSLSELRAFISPCVESITHVQLFRPSAIPIDFPASHSPTAPVVLATSAPATVADTAITAAPAVGVELSVPSFEALRAASSSPTFSTHSTASSHLPSEYGALVHMTSRDKAMEFVSHFDQRRFNSIEPDICSARLVLNVAFAAPHETLAFPPIDQEWNCPVCLDVIVPKEPSALLISLCNHFFHLDCLSKWSDSSCPVCRYNIQPDDITSCCVECQLEEDLWLCLLCGYIGCGRFEGRWRDCSICYHGHFGMERGQAHRPVLHS